MPKGPPPFEYFHNPDVRKPIEKIYADIDAFNHEYFEDEPEFYDAVSLFTVIPPLLYEGHFLKGLMFSQGVDLLHSRYPLLEKLFHSMAFSMWSSYPRSKSADAYFTCYKNQHRENWYRKQHPDKKDKTLIPLLDSDYVNEYWFAPGPLAERDIDVLCVSRLHEHKNLEMLAEALKIYRRKYPEKHIRMTLIVGKEFDLNLEGLNPHEKGQLRKMTDILGNLRDYIDLIPRTNYYPDLPRYYSRAKVCVMASLIEGKNRSLLEAMSCNTPVVCFEEYNQYARAGQPIFPEAAGLTAKFNAESLADTLHTVLENRDSFRPRREYLTHYGRKNFLNTCIDSLRYYQENLPGYTPGETHINEWLDLAIQQNYQLSFNDYLYDSNMMLSSRRGFEEIDYTLDFYFARFCLK